MSVNASDEVARSDRVYADVVKNLQKEHEEHHRQTRHQMFSILLHTTHHFSRVLLSVHELSLGRFGGHGCQQDHRKDDRDHEGG